MARSVLGTLLAAVLLLGCGAGVLDKGEDGKSRILVPFLRLDGARNVTQICFSGYQLNSIDQEFCEPLQDNGYQDTLAFDITLPSTGQFDLVVDGRTGTGDAPEGDLLYRGHFHGNASDTIMVMMSSVDDATTTTTNPRPRVTSLALSADEIAEGDELDITLNIARDADDDDDAAIPLTWAATAGDAEDFSAATSDVAAGGGEASAKWTAPDGLSGRSVTFNITIGEDARPTLFSFSVAVAGSGDPGSDEGVTVGENDVPLVTAVTGCQRVGDACQDLVVRAGGRADVQLSVTANDPDDSAGGLSYYWMAPAGCGSLPDDVTTQNVTLSVPLGSPRDCNVTVYVYDGPLAQHYDPTDDNDVQADDFPAYFPRGTYNVLVIEADVDDPPACDTLDEDACGGRDDCTWNDTLDTPACVALD